MLVTAGMVKEVFVLPAGYCTKVVLFLLYKIPFSDVYAVLDEPTFIAVRLVQPKKAPSTMLVTLFGMVILVRL
jgi:hypothetical protein